ncbi:MAG: cation diffusion facilitator family transporter [Candidatus Aureabacteria bacterium]|nr:cation diffusion facilitator family transporter [Candidatus Auribacterota bacterium]
MKTPEVFAVKKFWGYLEGWISVVINTALFALKFWVGCQAGSVAMIADSWHTLSDTLTSVVVIVGFWIAAKPADHQHPFGHGRAETVAAIIIGTLLAVVGADFMMQSIRRLINYQSATFSIFAIVVFLISVFFKEALAQFSFWAGRKINSSSLMADGWHHRSDAIASGLIVVGALIGGYFWWMDGVLGIGVSLLILYAAFDIIRTASSVSMGEAHSEELEQRVRDIIRTSAPAVADVHQLRMHKYGDYIELTLHLCFPPEMSVREAHALAARVKYALKDAIQADTTVHLEPRASKNMGQERDRLR